MFTEDNTEGFTAAELTTINTVLFQAMEAADIREDLGDDRAAFEKAIKDRINNAWVPGITEEQLLEKVAL